MSKASKPVKIKEATVWVWCDETGKPWVWTAGYTRQECMGYKGLGATPQQFHKFRLVPVKENKR